MAADLLAWYDRHARVLPWRAPPGSGLRPDPYRVWLSEIMLQQTTVAAVRPYFETFAARWPDVQSLAAAEDASVMAAWAGLGYYARARNLLACARAVTERHRGRFPDTEAELKALPGIGDYTAAAVAAIAFGRPAAVLDGNVERVMARIHAVETPLPRAKPALRALAAALTPQERPGDYAQAVMDLGATICTPRSPACGICPWREPCAARRLGIQTELPRKAAKPVRPARRGAVFLALGPDGRILTERRPERGLLGGMLGLPGGAWGEAPEAAAPLDAAWVEAGEVLHVFTHFTLRLRVLAARVPAGPGEWTDAAQALVAAPGVMRKAIRLGLAALREDAAGGGPFRRQKPATKRGTSATAGP